MGEKEYRDVRNYLLSLVDEISDPAIRLLNKSLDIVNFISEWSTSNRVLIEFPDGETLEVLVSDLEFPIRIS